MMTFKAKFLNSGLYEGDILFTKYEIIDFTVRLIYAHYKFAENFIIHDTDRKYEITPLNKKDNRAIENKSRFQITYKVKPKEKINFPADEIKENRTSYLELNIWNRIKFNMIHDRYFLFQNGKLQTGIWFIAGLIAATIISNSLSCNKGHNEVIQQNNYESQREH